VRSSCCPHSFISSEFSNVRASNLDPHRN